MFIFKGEKRTWIRETMIEPLSKADMASASPSAPVSAVQFPAISSSSSMAPSPVWALASSQSALMMLMLSSFCL